MSRPAAAPFGRVLTAMVTPFAVDGSLDITAARRLANYLVDEQCNDGLVVSGTTGEAPTLSDLEKAQLLAAVVEAVGDRASVIAGVGTFDTRHTIDLAKAAAGIGATGLLVVTPYYSRPPQSGLHQHFSAIADATALPVMLYDIPRRAGVEIATDTIVGLAGHPNIVAVKDAKGDMVASSAVMAATDLAYYAADDALTLPLLAVGGVGVVGTSTHFCGPDMKQLIEAHLAGDVVAALRLHRRLLPIFTGIFATQGCILVKAGLALGHRSVGPLRSPMVAATDAQIAALAAAMTDAGLPAAQ